MENILTLIGRFVIDVTSYSYLALFVLTMLDLILGNIRAIVQKKVNSAVGKQGWLINAALLIVPGLLLPFADVMGYGDAANALISFLVISQAYSVVENWTALGLPFNQKWLKIFDDKKIEQKQRVNSVHTDDPVPDETDKKL
ncbi:phage holin family protein [Weissella minor]|uniref:phage holin family protein n=1 Tax=Weissella minor TaxID=1620 RepID=UPI001BAF6CEF|nr:phage holin family protein [Weissella minor]MBS0950065.1 phage holin family protein [Weissella minor]